MVEKTNGKEIIIYSSLNQAKLRSVLTHELIHMERGIFSTNIREENTVDTISARRLIDLQDLIKALLWTGVNC